jgi:putative membrane protein insertion efficiency factor
VNGTAIAGTKANIDYILSHSPPDLAAPAETSRFTFDEVSEVKLGAMGLIRLYQLFVSSQDMSVCNFTPSCSRFGMASIGHHGLVQGLLMTSDRLLRCNGMGMPHYPKHPTTGKCFDPPEQELLW